MNGKIETLLVAMLALTGAACGGSSEEEMAQNDVAEDTSAGGDVMDISTPTQTDPETEVTVIHEPAPGEQGMVAAVPVSAAPAPAPVTPEAPPGASCPTAIEGVRVQVSNAAKGARVTFIGARDQVEEIRLRVQRLADETRTGMATDATATPAPAAPTTPAAPADATASAPVNATLVVEDHARGARLTVEIEDRARRDELRRVVREWASQIEGGTCARMQLVLTTTAAPQAGAPAAAPADPVASR